MIEKELGGMTSVSHSAKPVHFGSSRRVELQKEPYQRSGKWWANYAVQIASTVNGSLEIECDASFQRGEIANAMIEACGNACATEQRGQKWVITACYQYVLYTGTRPDDVQPA